LRGAAGRPLRLGWQATHSSLGRQDLVNGIAGVVYGVTTASLTLRFGLRCVI
jgi:hypothetical protein